MKKQVKISLDEKTKNILDEIRGGTTYRELLMRGAGLPVEEKSPGRPSKVESDLKAFHERWRKQKEDEIRARMVRYVEDYELRQSAVTLTCPRCGNEFKCSLGGPAQVPCWRCGYLVTLPVEESEPWRQPEEEPTDTLGSTEEINEYLEQIRGNLVRGAPSELGYDADDELKRAKEKLNKMYKGP